MEYLKLREDLRRLLQDRLDGVKYGIYAETRTTEEREAAIKVLETLIDVLG